METLIKLRDGKEAVNMCITNDYISLLDINTDEKVRISEDTMVRYIQWIISEQIKHG